MMGENEKFIVRISCDPKIEPFGEDFSTKFVDKILTLRVEKVNESVISQLRELMKEKGINELIAIDESKVLEIVKKAQAFDIIKKHILNRDMDTSGIYLEFHNGRYEPYYTIEIRNGVKQIVPQEEYNLLEEVLVCH